MEAASKPPSKSKQTRVKGPTTVARAYFEAIAARDIDAAAALWEPGSTDRLVGMAEFRVPGEFKQWFSQLFSAFPDFRFEVLSIAASKENAAVRWKATGTFNGTARFEGMTPNGAWIEVEGCDMMTIKDGKIVENHGYMNATDVARQLGAMPPAGSAAERGMVGAVNAKTAAVKAIQRLRDR
ncbi:MAG TPA: ester cyclase [Candidatus Limnocylindrales bacterium]|nr:ester cyclase [Candidatus Limnocylindrales bacterium]